ncbi:alpha/beta fold hydrolase [Chondromyces crocatus]|uniref:Alpha/beta hydrolase n=1 Tax=Chondromyces crocatus TaxID=52 RepID=A0A0K1EGM9_CHOCO|nr:alpha/beta hydrolase [Chondromyces crocatus]AKT40004.1 alpha/beta hydrolase [Chondromyces crocatus]
MQTARIGDLDIHYQVFGEGEPVLLIMGLGTRGDSWTPMAQALAGSGYQAIQFDNRDIGWSSLVEHPQYEIADMAEDALGLLDHLGLDQVHLVGISMGGMIAQQLLTTHPARFRKAVLLATWAGGRDVVASPPELLAPALTPGLDHDTAQRRLLTAIAAPGFIDAHPELLAMVLEASRKRPASPAAVARQLAAVLRWSSWDKLPEVTTPTLVIHGDHDPLIPLANGQRIAERIPGARLLVLPGVGHLVPMEAPRETFTAIQRFLAEA